MAYARRIARKGDLGGSLTSSLGAPGRSTLTSRYVSRPHDTSEVEADRAADAMVSGQPAAVSAAEPTIARAPALDDSWGDDYHKPAGPRDATIDYDKYKNDIGTNKAEPALVPASEWHKTDTWNQNAKPGDHSDPRNTGGIARSTQLTQGEWDSILASSGEPATAARCKGWLGQVNTAFDTMMLDTVQSQAVYLAHMVGETGGKLEETIDASTGPRDYDNDATGHFRGRGPVQVTFRKSYMQCIAYIETRAEQIEKKDIPELQAKLDARGKELGQDKEAQKGVNPAANHDEAMTSMVLRLEKLKKELDLCKEAAAAIKANPEAAADEKYAFLFSAAFMQMAGKVRSSADMGAQTSFDGKSAAAVAGSGETFDETQKKAAAKGDGQTVKDMDSAKSRGSVKEKVYAAAFAILSGKQKVKEPDPAAAK